MCIGRSFFNKADFIWLEPSRMLSELPDPSLHRNERDEKILVRKKSSSKNAAFPRFSSPTSFSLQLANVNVRFTLKAANLEVVM